jgi:N-acetylmuramoyl-L-alanine amidase
MTKIYIDAGHGGKDPGATGNGLVEKDLNLSITKRIEEILNNDYENVQTLTTRDTDIFLSLTERTDKANSWQADVFLSVHCNAAPNPLAKGFQTHIYTTPLPQSSALQNIMHPSIFDSVKEYNVSDLGKYQSNFHVVRESKMPAILTENFFVTSVTDSGFLKKPDFIERLAQGHVTGLEKFFGLKKKPKVTPPPTDEPSGKLYQVVAGTFADYQNAENMVAKLKADKYESYIQEK